MAVAEDFYKSMNLFIQVNLEVRLAENQDEINAAQSLRYKVFYEEMSAKPNSEMLEKKRDFDRFDEFWDHLLVLDNSKKKVSDRVVGTYRLNRRTKAKKCRLLFN